MIAPGRVHTRENSPATVEAVEAIEAIVASVLRTERPRDLHLDMNVKQASCPPPRPTGGKASGAWGGSGATAPGCRHLPLGNFSMLMRAIVPYVPRTVNHWSVTLSEKQP